MRPGRTGIPAAAASPPGCARNVSHILRRQVDHGGASPTIWTGGRMDGANGGPGELIYRDDTSILLAYILRRALDRRRRMREINYYGVRAARAAI